MSYSNPLSTDSCGDEGVEIAGVDYVGISARDLGRSAEFYRRLFGLRIVDEVREQGGTAVLMRTSEGVYLGLHEGRSTAGRASAQSRFSFVVGDIDRARAAVWNLGVPTADGSDEPRRRRSWRASRSFVIRDPDGHEIELVEQAR